MSSPVIEQQARGREPDDPHDDAVRLESVVKDFGAARDTVRALGPIDLTVAQGEFVVLVGPSGSGKSMLLRLIAGLDRPTAGAVAVDGRAPSTGRNVGVVFQQPRLLPWRTVGGNVSLALAYAGVPREARPIRTARLLERVGLGGLARRRVWEISGGQQQRVAIARALAAPTPVLLMDEPFAALDALTRERLQDDVRTFGAVTGGASAEAARTTVFVTHSPDEAAVLGSRVVVLSRHPGRVVADLASPLPRGASDVDLRGTAAYASFRAEISAAVRSAAS